MALAMVDEEEEEDEGYLLTQEELRKVRQKLPSGMAEEMDALGGDELVKKIVNSVNAVHTAKHFKQTNPEIAGLVARLKDLRGPPNDIIKTQDAVQAYARHKLETKGKL